MKAGKSWLQPALLVAVIALIVSLSGRVGSANTETVSSDPAPCRPQTVRVGDSCYDASPSGPAPGVAAAAQACAVAGGWLPTPKQLLAARAVLDLDDGSAGHAEFTDSYGFDANGHPRTTVISSRGSHSVPVQEDRTGQGSAYRYICIYPLPASADSR